MPRGWPSAPFYVEVQVKPELAEASPEQKVCTTCRLLVMVAAAVGCEAFSCIWTCRICAGKKIAGLLPPSSSLHRLLALASTPAHGDVPACVPSSVCGVPCTRGAGAPIALQTCSRRTACCHARHMPVT